MVKPRRKNTNRRKSSRIVPAVARLATGVPVSLKRVPNDPPMLPHVVAYPVRVRFNVHLVAVASGTGSTVVSLSGTPYGPNAIDFNFNPVGNVAVYPSMTVTFNELFIAAAMRIFGVDISVNQTQANYMYTDFAIQKVTLYGAHNETATDRDIVLSVDFGDQIPGFIGRDSGNRRSRSVVSCAPPRLAWRKVITGDTRVSVNFAINLGTFGPLLQFRANGTNNPANQSSWNIGTLDATILVRRSFISMANTFAREPTIIGSSDVNVALD